MRKQRGGLEEPSQYKVVYTYDGQKKLLELVAQVVITCQIS